METESTAVGLSIPILPQMELTAIKTAEAVGEFIQLERDKIDEIKMAVIEACINAFEHSQSDSGRIDINFHISDEELAITISDQGQGFDIEERRDEVSRNREAGESRRGWGLRIIEELMDRVEIESGATGTTLTLVKRR